MGLRCKSNAWTDVVVGTSSWSSDDHKLLEFFRIHMLLTSLRLVLMLTITLKMADERRPDFCIAFTMSL